MVRLLTLPLRLYRQRISVQLILSSVAVVLLTMILVELVIFGFAYLILRSDEIDSIDQTMAAQAQQAAFDLGSMPAMRRVANGNGSPADLVMLSLLLSRWTEEGVMLAPAAPPIPLGDEPRAALYDPEGRVITATDATWEPGTSYDTQLSGPAIIVVSRALELRGDVTAWGNTYVLDLDDDTMAVAHPVIVDDTFAGVLLFQARGHFVVGSSPPRYLDMLILAAANVVLLMLMILPTFAVAIPIGFLQARKISKRLERLSAAATAMAQGDLDQRVAIEGEDEVARVGRRFNEMAEQLQRADRSRRAFVSNVSHELRTPVAILQGNLERMRAEAERPGGAPPDPATLEALHQETLTLSRLIDDLFTIARIEESALVLEAGPVDLNAAIRHAVDGIARLAWEQSRVSVQSVAPEGLPQVLGERARVQQVLGNLLHNALRHTPEGGLIVVDAGVEGDSVWVTVSDTGIGIAPEDLAHVFDRYYQGERSGRHAGGSGLGLAVVKQLVEGMGGTVSVTSQIDQGTTFRFSLPRYHESR